MSELIVCLLQVALGVSALNTAAAFLTAWRLA